MAYFPDSIYIDSYRPYPPQACTFIKEETLGQVFSYEFSEISKNTFFTEHLWITVSVESSLKKRFSLEAK